MIARELSPFLLGKEIIISDSSFTFSGKLKSFTTEIEEEYSTIGKDIVWLSIRIEVVIGIQTLILNGNEKILVRTEDG